MNEQYMLGIDFGTTNTTAAIQRGGAPPEMLRLGTNSNAIPSAVLARDGGYLVGEEATRLAVLDPAAYERTPKRLLGHASMLLGGSITEPAHLVAAVLTRVLETARSRSRGIDPNSMVITYPHAWAGHRLSELQRAVSALPFTPNSVQFLTEPVATAYAHLDAISSGPGTRIAVADFGGGTFDVAVLESAGSSCGADPLEAYRIVGTGGVDPLGGDDFDVLLEDLALARCRTEGHERLAALLDEPDQLAARLTFREEVRGAKHALSYHASTALLVAVAGERAVLTLTAAEFELLLRPDLDRALAETRRVIDGDGIDHLFLTGGSSLIPLVQREFQQLTSGRVGTLGDPKEVTALGALLAPNTAPRTPAPARAVTLSKQPMNDVPPRLAAAPSRLTTPQSSRSREGKPAPLSGPARRARTALLWFAVPCFAFTFVVAIAALLQGAGTYRAYDGALNAVFGLSLLFIAVAAPVTTVTFCRWDSAGWRRSGSAPPIVRSIGTTVLLWWVPGINLYAPGGQLRRLTDAWGARPVVGARDTAWWALWATAQLALLGLLAVLVVSPGVEDSVLNALAMLGAAALGMSSLLLATIVSDIDRALTRHTTHASNKATAI